MEKQWLRVDISCAAENANELGMEVAEAFSVAVEMTDFGIRVYLEGEGNVESQHTALEAMLGEFQLSWHLDLPLTYSTSLIAEEDWADCWKEYFKPLRVGQHFLICPTWEKVTPGPEDIVVVLDPGRAFGTGHHESTRLCLEWLERWAAEQTNITKCALLDVGTGSGILAMAAAMLGCGKTVGLDVDPEAIEVARENLQLNGLNSMVALRIDTAAAETDFFDAVVANIQALPLIAMAEDLTARLGTPARLALSGILVEQKAAVTNAYEAQGLNLIDTQVAGEWCLLVFERA